MALSAGITALAAVRVDELALLVLALGGLGTAALGAALARDRAGVVVWAVLAVGAAVAIALSAGSGGARAPIYGAALLAVAELAYWSLEARIGRPAVGGIEARRVALVSGLVAGGLAVGAIVVSVGQADPGASLVLEAAGVAAAVAAVALVLVLSRRAG